MLRHVGCQSKPTISTTTVSFFFLTSFDPAECLFFSALESLFVCLGITTEHARNTATSFMHMLVAVENTSAAGSGCYEVFFAPEDDFCGLSDDDDSLSKLSDDDLPELVNSPTALTASSNTLIASASPALLPSFPGPANSTAGARASTVAPSAPPAVAFTGTARALLVSPVAPVVAPVSARNTTSVLAAGVTASTAALYAVPFVWPVNAPLNAVSPPVHLITPIYGYHVPAASAAGPFYAITRGRDIGIFAGW